MKIAFTSCINFTQYPNQAWWQDIEIQNPDYLLLLGDNIYMDYPHAKQRLKHLKAISAKDYGIEMDKMYENQFGEENFKRLFDKLNSNNRVFAIWDDHDFLWNNSNGAYLRSDLESSGNEVEEKLKVSRELFFKYLKNNWMNYPEIYYYVDTAKARLIFLDNRSYSLKAGLNSDLLGESQFKFLENSLRHDKDYTLICGGITLSESVIKDNPYYGENWLDYPKDLIRLCRLISEKQNAFYLSGDIHRNRFGEPKFLKDIRRLNKPENVDEIDFNKWFTPPQFISSGFALKMPVVFRNWAILNIDDQGLSIEFYRKDSKNDSKTTLDKKTTNQANSWLQANNYYAPPIA